MRQIDDLVDRQVRLWDARGRAADAGVRADAAARFRPIVTVSREAGCDGARIAGRVADRLGFPVFDREILTRIAERARVVESMVASVDESGRNWIEDSVQTLFNSKILSRSEYLEHLTRAVLAIASKEGAVIVGRGAEHILPRERRLAVRLVAPEDWRVAHLAESRGISTAAALESVRATDEGRQRFIRQHFGGAIDDVHAYDVVLDASRFGQEALAAIIEEAYRAL